MDLLDNELRNGKVNNGDHFHNIQYDTIQEVPEAHQTTKKMSPSKVAVSGPAVEFEINSSGLNSDMDGGYGWVIVMSSFFIAFIVDGIGSSFGLLLPKILSRFEASTFVTSFAGSLFMAFVIMGSISTILVRKFGFRSVTVAGSVLSCVAFVISAVSPNIYIFIVAYGLLAGCSCGLVFIPSIVIVNEYFHEKRGLANGIISSGSGVGLLVLAPVISVLLETYSLSGTVLILAGILLNMGVFSSLFRPLRQSQTVYVSGDCDDKDCYSKSPVESLSSNLSTDNVDQFALGKISESKTKNDQIRKKKGAEPSFDINEVLRKCQQIYETESSLCDLNGPDDREDAKKSSVYVDYMLSHLKPDVSVFGKECTSTHFGNHRSLDQYWLDDNKQWRSGLHLDLISGQPITKYHHAYSMSDIPARSWVNGSKHQLCKTFVRSHKYLNYHDHHRLNHSHQPIHQHHHSQNLSIDHGSSFYLAGSISTLLNLHSRFLQTLQGSDPRTVHSVGTICKKIPEKKELLEDCKMISEQLLKQDSDKLDDGDLDKHYVQTRGRDFLLMNASSADSGSSSLTDSSTESRPLGYTLSQLLCIPSFHFFCLGASLIQIGYPLAGTFLAEYASQFGLTSTHTAILMSLLGGLNICGRLLAGVLVYLKVDPLLLNNVSLLLGGAACLMSSLYTQFWSLCVFAGMFGFFLGFFPPLQPLIIVKHFGLDSLASAFGFLSTIKGVASILGAPLAGYIYDITGLYSMSFMFGGVVFVLSSFVHSIMACSGKFRNQKLCPLPCCKRRCGT